MEHKDLNNLNIFRTPKEGQKTLQTDDSKEGSIFLDSSVRRRKDELLKNRLQTLIFSRGMSESEFYSSLNLSRQVWYALSWGIWKPTQSMKIKVAMALGVDSRAIWKENEND